MSKITTVIPHFQREKGILPKAVKSTLNQQVDDLHVIVVDDGSPIPAREELKDLLHSHKDRITVIEQANGGAGSARNRGLDSVLDDCEYVAFLDSDDEWTPGHIVNAISALDRGYDFYFSDFYFSDYKEQTAFNRAGKITPGEHRLLEGTDNLYAYTDNMHDQIIVKGNVIGTSNVVYRYKKFPELRFREEFYNGQDYLFWLDLSVLTDRIVFSPDIECDCGLGINIYAATGWGTEGSLNRLKNEIMVWTSVKHFFDLTPYQNQTNSQHLATLRKSVVRDILHRVRHRKPIQRQILKELFSYDPGLVMAFIPILIRILIGR